VSYSPVVVGLGFIPRGFRLSVPNNPAPSPPLQDCFVEDVVDFTINVNIDLSGVKELLKALTMGVYLACIWWSYKLSLNVLGDIWVCFGRVCYLLAGKDNEK